MHHTCSAACKDRHEWSDKEMDLTIDLHVANRNDITRRSRAIDALAARLSLCPKKVIAAVEAVAALDPQSPRTSPRPSYRLEELWVGRGFLSKYVR